MQSVLLHRESVFAAPEAQALAARDRLSAQPQRTEPLRFVSVVRCSAKAPPSFTRSTMTKRRCSSGYISAEAAALQWQQHGFYAAMQQFAARHGIEGLLPAATAAASPITTSFGKLAEEDEQNHNPAALEQWLLAEIQAAWKQGRSSEAHLLRLESDEALVKIVTMHAAKGLQYPLVDFFPVVWDVPAANPTAGRFCTGKIRANGSPKVSLKKLICSNWPRRSQRAPAPALTWRSTGAEEQLTLYAAHCDNTAAIPLPIRSKAAATAALPTPPPLMRPRKKPEGRGRSDVAAQLAALYRASA